MGSKIKKLFSLIFREKEIYNECIECSCDDIEYCDKICQQHITYELDKKQGVSKSE